MADSRGLRGRKLLFVLVAFLVLNYDECSSQPSLIDRQCGDFSYMNVDFGGESKYKLSDLTCGDEVPLDKVNAKKAPSVTFQDAENGVKYLIAMIDPDAPQVKNPYCQSWLHWIVGNIDGKDLAKGVTSSGETFTDYNPPTPPPPKAPATTNVHKYFIYVFKQLHDLDKSDVSDRCGFDIDDYSKGNRLNPVAMNMFKTHS